MTRFNRLQHAYDYDYSGSGGGQHSSVWDTRTFIGVDNDGGDDEDETDYYSRTAFGRRRPAAAASVIGYGGDLPFRPRSRRPSTTNVRESRDDGGCDRVRIRPVRQRDATTTTTGQNHGRRTTLRPSLSAGFEKESLKQRLRLDQPVTPFFAGGVGTSSDEHLVYSQQRAQYHPYHHPRARSLSLSRLSGGLSDSSPELGDEEDDDNEESEGADADDADSNEWRRRRRRTLRRAAPSFEVAAEQVQRRQPRSQYRLLDLGLDGQPVPGLMGEWPAPGGGLRSRSGSGGRGLEMSDMDGYERGYQALQPVEPGRQHSLHGDDLMRLRLGGGGGRFPNPRVSRRKSESFEKLREGGRGGKDANPGVRAKANSKYRGAKPQYNKVHALILTWSFHDLRLEDYTAPPGPDYVSLEQETVRLRATLEGYGYAVHEFLIPMHRSTESLKTKIKQFCSRYAADDTLLIIYYHGHGALDDENELVFSSHDHPENAEWLKAAAADLYAALLSNGPYPTPDRLDNHQDLLKKYERLRPVSSVPWSAIRNPILSAAADVLLVLDCCAAGGASLRHVHWQPPPGAEDYTKHLFAACGFESSTSDDMTAALCEVLDEWESLPAAPQPPPSSSRAASVIIGGGAVGGGGGGIGGGTVGGPPVGAGQSLTTKRLHQLMEDKLQKRSVGSQPIFKQLLPLDPEQYITLPNLRRREANSGEMKLGERRSRGRRGYIIA
ncbi:nipped-B-like protein B [Corynascus novoguineensis]|uniref:Nipped-B-like protein B n=1 Tax=Corynascus novoguineensis TaxID=1126955 RepID=A0AAN7CRR4_9PEZI|nr:nipped-B-like protein B [Corynascus novoguineensis]